MSKRKLSKMRLWVLSSSILLIVIPTITGSWRAAIEAPNEFSGFRYEIAAEIYAASIGKTVAQINQEFRERDFQRYLREKADGLPDCSLFATQHKCAVQPIQRGGPLLAPPVSDAKGLLKAALRTIPSFYGIFRDIAITVGLAFAACFLIPALFRVTRDWLFEPDSKGT